MTLGHEATPRGAMEMPVRLEDEGAMTKARCQLHRVRAAQIDGARGWTRG